MCCGREVPIALILVGQILDIINIFRTIAVLFCFDKLIFMDGFYDSVRHRAFERLQ